MLWAASFLSQCFFQYYSPPHISSSTPFFSLIFVDLITIKSLASTPTKPAFEAASEVRQSIICGICCCVTDSRSYFALLKASCCLLTNHRAVLLLHFINNSPVSRSSPCPIFSPSHFFQEQQRPPVQLIPSLFNCFSISILTSSSSFSISFLSSKMWISVLFTALGYLPAIAPKAIVAIQHEFISPSTQIRDPSTLLSFLF